MTGSPAMAVDNRAAGIGPGLLAARGIGQARHAQRQRMKRHGEGRHAAAVDRKNRVVHPPMQRTKMDSVRLEVEGTRVNSLNRVNGVHDIQNRQFVRQASQSDAATNSSLQRDDPFPPQPLQNLGQVGCRDLRAFGNLTGLERPVVIHRQMHDRSQSIFHRLRKHSSSTDAWPDTHPSRPF